MSALAEYPVRRAAAGRLLPEAPVRSRAAYLERYGRLPRVTGREGELLDAVEASGLTGRGGAGFPTAIKLRTVARGRRPVVVANGTEGEPASGKDKALMTRNPHLVLDGAIVASRLVGARETIVAVSREAVGSLAALRQALAERPDEGISLEAVPERFVAGEETALVHWLNGGEAKPTYAPPRPFERGVRGRPTLVQNVETLAGLALVARYGPAWFRKLGTEAEPGSVLVTVRGAVRGPGVVEVELGTPLREVIARCGGLEAVPQAILVGGYFGAWIAPDPDLPLSNEALRPLGAALGARTIAVLAESSCGVAETARVASYMAAQSAGQCGPCVFGLAAVADCLARVAGRHADGVDALERLPRLHAQIARRGACAHPDGTLGFVQSALGVFAREIEEHLAGRCSATDHEPVLPTPLFGDWR